MICLLLFPTIATAFSTIKTHSPMTKATSIRRTSSVAYDDQSHGPKYSFYGGDSWSKRTRSSLSSSRLLEDECSDDRPMFSFGILTDIQYAPIPDGHSYNGTPRYYRHAITAAEHAARHFEEEKVQCVVNLGDIIDGKCSDVDRYGGSVAEYKDEKKIESLEAVSVGHIAVDDVLKALSCYKNGRIIHTYGELTNNHKFRALVANNWLMQQLISQAITNCIICLEKN